MKLLDPEAPHGWFELVILTMKVDLHWTFVWPGNLSSPGLLQASP
jgi:hypothetical protein